MTIIAHPIGDIDEYLIISDIYKPNNFQEGWYFLPTNFPYYQFVSTDINPNEEEVFEENGRYYVDKDYFSMYADTIPFSKQFIYPSGVPYSLGRIGDYWELFGDLDNPYLFIPYFNKSTYGEIVYLDLDISDLPKSTQQLPLLEKILNGLVLTCKEKVVSDSTWTLPLKEKLISLLNFDIELLAKNKLRLTWGGEHVDIVEILRKGISDKKYTIPIASIPFENGEYVFELDNNSYVFTIRGINGTGECNSEVTIGVAGLTTMAADIDLGDYIKIFEIDMCITKTYEIEIQM